MGRGGGESSLRRHLLLFARLPEPGRTKTRLAPAVGDRGAAILYRAFLSDVVEGIRRVSAERRQLWVPRRPDAAERLGARFPDLELRWQQGKDLGARLEGALLRAFEEGADRVLIVGSDHPTLPAVHLERGFRALSEAELVLGPTEDGGYYAVGMRRNARRKVEGLLDGVPWSTADVREETLRRARERDLRVAELPGWYDVDEPEDLARLWRDLERDSASARALRRLAAPVD